MPILGLTDGEGRLPSIGDLRKGAEHVQGEAPRELEYFRFTSSYPELEQQFTAAYGPKPTEVLVRLPYPSVDACLEAWYESYTAGSMQLRCNGQSCVWQRTASGIREDPVPCYRAATPPCQCEAVGRLHVIVPSLGMLGTVTVRTGSSNDIRTLYRVLKGLADPATGAGLDLRSVPFVLRRVARDIPTPGKDGKQVRRTKYLLDLQVDPSAVGEVIRALGTARPLGALPAPASYLPPPQDEGRDWDVDQDTGEVLEGQVTEDPQAPAQPSYPEAAGRMPIPRAAWEKLKREPDPEVLTLKDADVPLLTAWAGTTYRTREGKAFATAAAALLQWIEAGGAGDWATSGGAHA